MTKAKKIVVWHVTVGSTVHDFTTRQAAKAYAMWMLGDDTAVWKSVSW